MEADTQGNALTEVALALAMAFFSLLVLALVGMGVPSSHANTGNNVTIRALEVLPVAVSDVTPSTGKAVINKTAVKSSDRFIFFYDGRYLHDDLRPADLSGLVIFDGRIVLAVSPDLTAVDMLSARSRINHQNLIVTTFDDRWQQRLEQLK